MFCTQPFNHIDIVVENDKVLLQPCNVWTAKRYSINEYNKALPDLKQTLEHTYHYPGCSRCFMEDKKNIRSRRKAQNEFANDNNLSNQKLQSLGVRYGTLCNSKCMICSHHRSSSWVADAEKLGLHVNDQHRYKKHLLPGVDIFFENFDLDDLRFVEFHGGEPLMQTYPEDFLSRVKHLDQLIVKFNTNLTILPSDRLMQLLKQCKRVDFLLSVDDIDERYEILRFPGKWKIFTKNLEFIKKQNFRAMAYNCLSSLNIYYCGDYYNWAIKNFGAGVHSQFVVDQKMLDISYLPKNAKDKVLRKIEKYTGQIFDSIRSKLHLDNEDHSLDLINYIKKLDAIRNTRFSKTFSEWWQILNGDLS